MSSNPGKQAVATRSVCTVPSKCSRVHFDTLCHHDVYQVTVAKAADVYLQLGLTLSISKTIPPAIRRLSPQSHEIVTVSKVEGRTMKAAGVKEGDVFMGLVPSEDSVSIERSWQCPSLSQLQIDIAGSFSNCSYTFFVARLKESPTRRAGPNQAGDTVSEARKRRAAYHDKRNGKQSKTSTIDPLHATHCPKLIGSADDSSSKRLTETTATSDHDMEASTTRRITMTPVPPLVNTVKSSAPQDVYNHMLNLVMPANKTLRDDCNKYRLRIQQIQSSAMELLNGMQSFNKSTQSVKEGASRDRLDGMYNPTLYPPLVAPRFNLDDGAFWSQLGQFTDGVQRQSATLETIRTQLKAERKRLHQTLHEIKVSMNACVATFQSSLQHVRTTAVDAFDLKWHDPPLADY